MYLFHLLGPRYLGLFTFAVTSLFVRIQTLEDAVLSPHSLKVLNVSYTYILISWQPPENTSDILNYQLHYSVHSDTQNELVKNIPTEMTTAYLKGLMSGTRYRFYIRANYSNGKLVQSNTGSEMTLGYGQDMPCSCSGWGSNSSRCDGQTGQCECKNKYIQGLNCDSCYSGYYYHVNLGCEPCNCHSKYSNGSCFVDNGIPKCHCTEGHTGVTCNMCERGYYMTSKSCEPCECNLNEDPHADMICTDYGRCVACLYNTAGDNCEVCKPGYIGDALHRNCTLVAKSYISHQVTIVLTVCVTIVGLTVIIIVILLYTRWLHYNKKPFSFWSVQLRDDHENVNFSAIDIRHDPNSIDAELLANDEVQFAAKEKPTLSFGSTRNLKS